MLYNNLAKDLIRYALLEADEMNSISPFKRIKRKQEKSKKVKANTPGSKMLLRSIKNNRSYMKAYD